MHGGATPAPLRRWCCVAYGRGRRNVTITLDEKTAAWVRVSAAREDMSVSRYIGELLEKRMRESRDYSNAMRRYLDREPSRINETGSKLPSRDELHERSDLR